MAELREGFEVVLSESIVHFAKCGFCLVEERLDDAPAEAALFIVVHFKDLIKSVHVNDVGKALGDSGASFHFCVVWTARKQGLAVLGAGTGGVCFEFLFQLDSGICLL